MLFNKEFEPYLRQHAKDEVLKQVLALPVDLQELGLVILSCDKNGKHYGYRKRKAYREFLDKKQAFFSDFNKLTKKSKLKIIECFCPSISNEILTAYEFNKRIPYSSRYTYDILKSVNTKCSESIKNAGSWLIEFLSNAMKIEPTKLTVEWLAINAAPVESSVHLSQKQTARLLASVVTQRSEQGNALYESTRHFFPNDGRSPRRMETDTRSVTGRSATGRTTI